MTVIKTVIRVREHLFLVYRWMLFQQIRVYHLFNGAARVR
jgi:hypothetical protein